MQNVKRNLYLSVWLSAFFFFSSEFLVTTFFYSNHQEVERIRPQISLTKPLPTPTPQVSIVFAGDVMLGRKVMIHSLDNKKDPRYPFLEVGDYLRSADLVFINLENPIVTDCPRIESGFKFCADPSMMEGLTYAGVDVVSLANNHTTNFGQEGLEQSVIHLLGVGVEATGVGNLIIKESKGTKFGFLGFDLVSRAATPQDLELVAESDSQVDVLIVGVHWGEEYMAVANNYQRTWAKKFIEAGADVIIGHHPHWIQDDEEIEGVPVYYSLGNFVFDQMWSEETKRGMTVKLTFENGNVVREERRFTYMPDWARTVFVE